jgi:selenocysteine-specific elongation factor
VTTEEAAARAAIETALKQAGLMPPAAAALAAQTGVPPSVAERVLHQLVKERRLVRLGDLAFHPEPLERLKTDIKAMRTGHATAVVIDVTAFKERYGLSRKFAIPLLEWLDRERVTRRVGEQRQVL